MIVRYRGGGGGGTGRCIQHRTIDRKIVYREEERKVQIDVYNIEL